MLSGPRKAEPGGVCAWVPAWLCTADLLRGQEGWCRQDWQLQPSHPSARATRHSCLYRTFCRVFARGDSFFLSPVVSEWVADALPHQLLAALEKSRVRIFIAQESIASP